MQLHAYIMMHHWHCGDQAGLLRSGGSGIERMPSTAELAATALSYWNKRRVRDRFLHSGATANLSSRARAESQIRRSIYQCSRKLFLVQVSPPLDLVQQQAAEHKRNVSHGRAEHGLAKDVLTSSHETTYTALLCSPPAWGSSIQGNASAQVEVCSCGTVHALDVSAPW